MSSGETSLTQDDLVGAVVSAFRLSGMDSGLRAFFDVLVKGRTRAPEEALVLIARVARREEDWLFCGYIAQSLATMREVNMAMYKQQLEVANEAVRVRMVFGKGIK